jgi:LacI family transcriptional regulator
MQRFHVSRNTLRVALAQLEREGLLSGGQGKRRQIIKEKKTIRRRPKSTHVVLLSSAPMQQQSPSILLWMDKLREQLASAGHALEFHNPLAAWRRHPGASLEELATRLAPAAWILHHSSREMQRWFSARALPCLIAGTRHSDVALPSVDMDHRAASRHAASRLLARGRRLLALLRTDTSLAGDAESVAGFREGAGIMEIREIVHNGTPHGVCIALGREFKALRPDGLFVFHAEHALTALGYLGRTGARIPQEVSFISRDDEPFLAHAVPAPARYAFNANVFARKVSRLVMEMLDSSVIRPRQHLLMPELNSGETL